MSDGYAHCRHRVWMPGGDNLDLNRRSVLHLFACQLTEPDGGTGVKVLPVYVHDGATR